MIKVWWHCLWRVFKDWPQGGHRMVKTTWVTSDYGDVSEWTCSCGYNLTESQFDAMIRNCDKTLSDIWWKQ